MSWINLEAGDIIEFFHGFRVKALQDWNWLMSLKLDFFRMQVVDSLTGRRRWCECYG
jgi:hypothetical protein